MKVNENIVWDEVVDTLRCDYGLTKMQASVAVEDCALNDPQITPLVNLLIKYQELNPGVIDDICSKILKKATNLTC